ncbi:hypothetical protein RUMCAL_03113 [Ruminococcus callidus ATCC 27760]|uniref:Uncharacterized protein n=1 Tax=Ruminococcus callidus ATCC 27760 TaxID=411473 RepID=U2LNG5_9FIRM|nr:hypothetical protein RUMCAL_03113 [Ruminococcus callidus ATCC 27760]
MRNRLYSYLRNTGGFLRFALDNSTALCYTNIANCCTTYTTVETVIARELRFL